MIPWRDSTRLWILLGVAAVVQAIAGQPFDSAQAEARSGDILTNTGFTARGFDSEQSFMLVEIDADVLRFQTISRRGKRVDSGEIRLGGTS